MAKTDDTDPKAPKQPRYRPETRLIHPDYAPTDHYGMVNPPVYRASTILFPDQSSIRAEWKKGKAGMTYGRHGTPTHKALEDAVSDMENAVGTHILPSGMAAISATLFGVLNSGDHLLLTDSAYLPGRWAAEAHLSRMGIETECYDPLIGGDIARLIRPNTRLIFMESPGSQTFEMQDVPAIVAAAKAAKTDRPLLTAIDNTWATPLIYKPLDHGVDISIHAGTKYLVGHADALLGTVCCRDEAVFQEINQGIKALGYATSPDEVYLAMRGMRTMAVRLEKHFDNAMTVARWLQTRPEVQRVLFPPLPDDPGHAIWQRDFDKALGGGSGLMGLVLQDAPAEVVEPMLAACKLFGIGYSWGGYESLISIYPQPFPRSQSDGTVEGPLLRLHVGLEHPDDLIADLEQAFSVIEWP